MEVKTLGENNWPGIYIKGDEAFSLCSQLEMFARAIERGDEMVATSGAKFIRNLKDQIGACLMNDVINEPERPIG